MTPETSTAAASVKANSLNSVPDHSAEKSDRRINRGEGDRHCDDRAGDLTRSNQSCLDRRLALLDVAEHIFNDHDGVIHDEADGEHHGEQCKEIETKPHRQHERPSADQRERNRDNRDQDRADGAQEQENDENNDRDGLTEGPNHIVDRGLDELAGVVGHVQF